MPAEPLLIVDGDAGMKNGKIGNAEQMCSARILQYVGGREKGERIVLIENGCLSFTVLLDRAADVCSLRHEGKNISFISKNGIAGFAEEYASVFCGGMLYTCGLDTLGDRKMPIHGKIHNLPAQIESLFADEERVELTVRVRQSSLFGENFVLRRRITTTYGSGRVEVENTILNEGFTDAGYCLLFHVNFGYPMLDACTTVEAPVLNTVPRTLWAEKNIEKCFSMSRPVVAEEEQVFYHTLSEGRVTVSNCLLKKRATVLYNHLAMPYLIEWKSMAAGDYALGIEPSTSALDDRFSEKILPAGQSHEYPLTIEVENIEPHA